MSKICWLAVKSVKCLDAADIYGLQWVNLRKFKVYEYDQSCESQNSHHEYMHFKVPDCSANYCNSYSISSAKPKYIYYRYSHNGIIVILHNN